MNNNNIRGNEETRSNQMPEYLNNNLDNLEARVEQLPDQMEKETFLSSSAFTSAVDNFEWDSLVGRGTGRLARETKWERESLYQKFDPLISARHTNGNMRISRADENRIGEPKNWFQNQEKVTTIAEATVPEDCQTGTELMFGPLSNFPNSRASVFSQSSDELEIEKLKAVLELQAKTFQNQLAERSFQLKQLKTTIAEASKRLQVEQQSDCVMREYEKSITAMEDKIDQVKIDILRSENERTKLGEERDHAVQDLRQAEFAFSDLHSKYEAIKQLLGNFKKNEDTLVKRYDLMKLKVERRDAKLKCLQDTVEDVFGKLKNDFESSIKFEEVENNRIRAQLRKLELRMDTIHKDLEQKEKENAQLSLLCDDLIKGQSAA